MVPTLLHILKLFFFQRAFTRYEAAMNIMVEIGDRYGQIDVLAGMSKTMTLMKQLAKVCECKVSHERGVLGYIA